MMKAEGAQALTYGEAQGYRGPARARVSQVRSLRGPEGHPGQHHHLERLRTRPVARLQRVRRRGRCHPQRGAHLLGHPEHHPPPRGARARRPRRRGGAGHAGGATAARGAPSRGNALQAHLHHRQLPEPVRADHEPAAAARAGGPRPRVRHLHPRGRRLWRAALRGGPPPLAVRAGYRRPRDPGGHGVEDPRRGIPPRLALRARVDDPDLPGLPLRRRRQSVRLAGRHLLPPRSPPAPRGACSSTCTGRSATRCCAVSTRCSTGSGAEISKPAGGFFLWIRLPAGTDQKRLADLAVRRACSTPPAPPSSPTAAATSSSASPTASRRPRSATTAPGSWRKAILDARS